VSGDIDFRMFFHVKSDMAKCLPLRNYSYWLRIS
jgi:hypothetical protein